MQQHSPKTVERQANGASHQKVKTRIVDPYFLCFPDAAKYLGYGLKAFRNGLSAGRFPFKPRHHGGKPLFRLEDLKSFAESLGVESTAPPRGGRRKRVCEGPVNGHLTRGDVIQMKNPRGNAGSDGSGQTSESKEVTK